MDSIKFRVGFRVRQTPEEGMRTYRPKRCENNNKDEDDSPKSLSDKNPQASFQKFRQQLEVFRNNAIIKKNLRWHFEELSDEQLNRTVISLILHIF